MFSELIGDQRPISWVLQFWPVLLVSFTVSLIATSLCKKIAIRFGIVDKPDDLVKTHKEPIAYLGGLGMMAGLAAGIMISIGIYSIHKGSYRAVSMLFGILAGAVIACGIGLVDDLMEIKPLQKVLGQLAAASMLVIVGIVPNIGAFIKPFDTYLPHQILSVLEAIAVFVFVLGATNSLNLLDGLDGLCGGVTAIITVGMLLLAVHLATWSFSDTGDPVRIIVCLALIGCVCGFLPFNRYPAKIFMGDAGSMLLGFVVAAIMILFGEHYPRWLMASVVLFGLPILDTAVALARRLINRRPLFVSDRGHIYDQMIDRGISLKKTVLICYLLALLYAVIGLLMSQIRTRYAAVVYVFVFAVSGLIIWKKGYLKMEGLRGAVKKKTDDA